ncbi:MAG: bifunctional 5,10-methylenetetrahydrofolate dehydrogenase/5,10-methenyltetrahydrofolate cyclohydrolase [Chloroflexi bacterium]|nr:bifunctional 5,10-methylenetetrahydrofolate dehydrogenase/5,10-methenyltetrahydrofolate cyclohydrolase [Chloroflexota bacterium]MCL5108333.1 bifunctional 5,10-methylenetetrahydrofolate dehydrogenase/5,10-methenyltetrahydrofolate cyclohydrolase [Chloroflexota bacterium]MDA8218249.1 bifunctional 5,10-methylenetetrahydrofolate dehydrogenase/5,10-methenyltetrahydrofolate cyclohydrolase [Dehalococcoidales bacterium]
MVARVLDGKALAAAMKEELKGAVAAFKSEHGFVPGITVVQVGHDPASERYVRQIGRSFEDVGMTFSLHQPETSITQAEMVGLVEDLNDDPAVSGIIVQMPLPKHLPQEAVANGIAPQKDVDGINPTNAGRLLAGSGQFFAPATPSGGMEILRREGVELSGRRAVVVGRSNIVGKPMALLLLHQNATVTICHSRTRDLPAVCREADILVAAIGKPRFITQDMIKPGAIVIDFGVNVVNGKAVGDVDYEAALETASAITPVPGGTGPMTNVMLLRNTLRAAELLLAEKG